MYLVSETRDFFPFDAYCCGQKMTKTYLDNGYIRYSCASGSHGRFFTISIDPKKQSYCSCDWGRSPMDTENFEDFRLYHGCFCGARYSILKDGTQVSFDIKGHNSDDVSDVALKSLSAIWDDFGGPFRTTSIADEKKLAKEVFKCVNSQIKERRDFFVSYNKVDKNWAKWIAGTLEENGYSVFYKHGTSNRATILY